MGKGQKLGVGAMVGKSFEPCFLLVQKSKVLLGRFLQATGPGQRAGALLDVFGDTMRSGYSAPDGNASCH